MIHFHLTKILTARKAANRSFVIDYQKMSFYNSKCIRQSENCSVNYCQRKLKNDWIQDVYNTTTWNIRSCYEKKRNSKKEKKQHEWIIVDMTRNEWKDAINIGITFSLLFNMRINKSFVHYHWWWLSLANKMNLWWFIIVLIYERASSSSSSSSSSAVARGRKEENKGRDVLLCVLFIQIKFASMSVYFLLTEQSRSINWTNEFPWIYLINDRFTSIQQRHE